MDCGHIRFRWFITMFSVLVFGVLVWILIVSKSQPPSFQLPLTAARPSERFQSNSSHEGLNSKTSHLNHQSKLLQPDTALSRGHSMTLAMHFTSKTSLLANLYCIILRSVVIFWPAKLGQISLIMDEESTEDHQFAALLKQQEESLSVAFDIKYQPLPENPEMFVRDWKKERGPGYQRQMHNTYLLDEYINTSVIVYTDSDVMFSAPVTPESIFNGNKLRVYGKTKWIYSPLVRGLEQATQLAIGKNLVAHYDPFPTYLWRDTVTNCRKHILTRLNVTRFEEAFHQIHGPYPLANPIKIINTYAYYFEHDRYDWHFPLSLSKLPEYNKIHVTPGYDIKPEETLPTPCLTTHKPNINRGSPFQQGYCVAMRHIGLLPAECKDFLNVTDLQLFVLTTDTHVKPQSDGWCTGEIELELCLDMSESHYRNVSKYHRLGLYDFNLERVSAIEKSAAEFQITCPPLFKPPLQSPDNI